MKLLLQSLMVFFGTLLAAGLVALGEPAQGNAMAVQAPVPAVGATVASLISR